MKKEKDCLNCGGVGRIVRADNIPWPECEQCEGTGKILTKEAGSTLRKIEQ